MYIYIYTHTYIHTYINTYIHMYTYIYIYTHTDHIYIYICIIGVYAHINVQVSTNELTHKSQYEWPMNETRGLGAIRYLSQKVGKLWGLSFSLSERSGESQEPREKCNDPDAASAADVSRSSASETV